MPTMSTMCSTVTRSPLRQARWRGVWNGKLFGQFNFIVNSLQVQFVHSWTLLVRMWLLSTPFYFEHRPVSHGFSCVFFQHLLLAISNSVITLYPLPITELENSTILLELFELIFHSYTYLETLYKEVCPTNRTSITW